MAHHCFDGNGGQRMFFAKRCWEVRTLFVKTSRLRFISNYSNFLNSSKVWIIFNILLYWNKILIDLEFHLFFWNHLHFWFYSIFQMDSRTVRFQRQRSRKKSWIKFIENRNKYWKIKTLRSSRKTWKSWTEIFQQRLCKCEENWSK